jgi:hypothetical protein
VLPVRLRGLSPFALFDAQLGGGDGGAFAEGPAAARSLFSALGICRDERLFAIRDGDFAEVEGQVVLRRHRRGSSEPRAARAWRRKRLAGWEEVALRSEESGGGSEQQRPTLGAFAGDEMDFNSDPLELLAALDEVVAGAGGGGSSALVEVSCGDICDHAHGVVLIAVAHLEAVGAVVGGWAGGERMFT